jgi:hypothetical protein
VVRRGERHGVQLQNLSVHSGKERQIQLFEEVIMPLPCFADLLIQGQQLSIDHL